jgi:hypothetical protein
MSCLILKCTISAILVDPQIATYNGKLRGTTDCEVFQDYLAERPVGKENFLSYAQGDGRHGKHCEALSHVQLHYLSRSFNYSRYPRAVNALVA